MHFSIKKKNNYTDRQKKRYNRILSGKTCGSQAAPAYHDKDLEKSIEVI